MTKSKFVSNESERKQMIDEFADPASEYQYTHDLYKALDSGYLNILDGGLLYLRMIRGETYQYISEELELGGPKDCYNKVQDALRKFRQWLKLCDLKTEFVSMVQKDEVINVNRHNLKKLEIL